MPGLCVALIKWCYYRHLFTCTCTGVITHAYILFYYFLNQNCHLKIISQFCCYLALFCVQVKKHLSCLLNYVSVKQTLSVGFELVCGVVFFRAWGFGFSEDSVSPTYFRCAPGSLGERRASLHADQELLEERGLRSQHSFEVRAMRRPEMGKGLDQ